MGGCRSIKYWSGDESLSLKLRDNKCKDLQAAGETEPDVALLSWLLEVSEAALHLLHQPQTEPAGLLIFAEAGRRVGLGKPHNLEQLCPKGYAK